ncbi:DNA translocase FtsK [Chlamydiales bacterium SCGC AB-751-O23]|jgi:DNA segregation ATPase FtsK/SpoIIIE, S-DNA-T family|nr:DNA translocase FtsK [Chlamydiales bacterium SCGC AB-751-O23]
MKKKGAKPKKINKPKRKVLFSKDEMERASILPLEVKGLLILGLNLIMALSLFTFSGDQQSDSSLGLMGYAVGWALQYTFGLGSYLLIIFLTYLGWKLLTNKHVQNIGSTFLYLFLMLLSTCMLLNVVAEVFPQVGAFFRPLIYSQYTEMGSVLSYKVVRDNLGGVPLYYLYSDIPAANLKRILGSLGTAIIFTTTLTISTFLINNQSFLESLAFFQKLFKREAKEDVSGKKFDFLKNLKISLFSREEPFEGISSENSKDSILNEIKTEIHTHSESKVSTPLLDDTPEPSKLPSPPIDLASEPPEPPLATSSAPSKVLSPEQAASIKEKAKEAAIRAQRIYNGDFENYKLPAPKLLTAVKPVNQDFVKQTLVKQASLLEQTLASFGIEAKVGDIHCGPTITSFEVHPAVGVKVQKIKALENDIALNLKAQSIRIIAPIPGKAAVGIEVPNPSPQEVSFREMLTHYQKRKKPFHIPVLLGKAVSGEHVCADLTKMPHCIIAGATGAGKSVCINTIIMSILMNAKPNEIKLLLIDPKKVELTPYNNLPHMIAPVITEPQGACLALNWLVKEMEKRYNIFKNLGVRNINAFNERKANREHEESLNLDIPEKMFYMVAIIDELADLMMVSTYDIETPIARIAQMARAVGIHLILATQRPSREVITGIIKANFPTRIAFKVASRINSQIILDETGAETLLGNGDLLFLPPGSSSLLRAQGAFIRDHDIQAIIDDICEKVPPSYLIESFDESEDIVPLASSGAHPLNPQADKQDVLFEQAKNLVIETQNASTTFLQRKLKIGYARAASLTDQLEEARIISPAEGNRARTVLIKIESPLGEESEIT